MARLLALAVSALWLFFGATKLLWPDSVTLASWRVPTPYAVLLGAIEVLLGVATLRKSLRIPALVTIAVASAVAIAYHASADPKSPCGCLGKIRLENDKMILVSALSATLSGLAILADRGRARGLRIATETP